MEKNDIQEASKLLNGFEQNDRQVTCFDPIQLMEEALFGFLTYRIQKLKARLDFQDELVDAIRARIPEADFNDLRIALAQEEDTINKVSSTLLPPFNTKVAENKNKKSSIEEEMFESSNKDNLQAFNELFQMVNSLKELSKNKENPIKKVLEESLKEKEE